MVSQNGNGLPKSMSTGQIPRMKRTTSTQLLMDAGKEVAKSVVVAKARAQDRQRCSTPGAAGIAAADSDARSEVSGLLP